MNVNKKLLIIITFLFYGYAFSQDKDDSLMRDEEKQLNTTENNTGVSEQEEQISQAPAPQQVQEQIQAESLTHQAESQPSSVTQPGPIHNKISLDIKGMDIVDVLKMLAQRANLNIVVGKNVTGRVTLFLKDIEPWDMFEIIILGNDLAYEKKGSIINVMTQRDYELQYGERFQDKKQVRNIKLKYAKAADLSRALNQIKTNIGKIVVDESSNTISLIDTPQKITEMEEFIKDTDLPLETKIFHLNYAQADKLNAKIQEIITKGVGSLRIDERTNKIIVTDYPKKIEEISNVINVFDEKTAQVLIDAQVIEVKPSDKFEMGVDWNYWIKKHFKVSASLPINTTNALILSTATSNPTKAGDYKGIIDLLRTIGDTKILSSPRIMVINNHEAKILVGTKDAYITATVTQTEGNAVTAESVNFVETGIKLFVTPTINRNGFVTMKIKPEVSSAETKTIISQDKKTDIPIVTSSEAETTVMVKDGVTIIIGGLRKDEHKKTVKKIPILGDIPWLRYLFSSTSDELKQTDLVILLTPHIMSGETAYTDFSEIKPTDGVIASMVAGDVVTERTVNPKDELSGEINAGDYRNLVNDRILTVASFNKPRKEKGEVEIEFVLSRKGVLMGNPYIIKSSNYKLNLYALKTIEQALPFPPFPKDLAKKKEKFKVTLVY